MFEGKLWPTEKELSPRSINYWMPNRPLFLEADEAVEGYKLVPFTVTETEIDVANRLNKQYPLYRIVNLGRQAVGKVFNRELEA